MKIATWNIERLKDLKNLIPVVENIQKINADILVLTEFDNLVELPFYEFKTETLKLPKKPYGYRETERRVAIFSKFPIIKTFKTYDEMTSCCAEIQTNFGNLIVYGTIVGILGYSDKNFKTDLEKQTKDINLLSKLGNFCYSGDLNITFSDSYYFTYFGREKFTECFNENNLINTTENLKENVDHIVISEKFLHNFKIQFSEWNIDKKFSDHKGICIELKNKNG